MATSVLSTRAVRPSYRAPDGALPSARSPASATRQRNPHDETAPHGLHASAPPPHVKIGLQHHAAPARMRSHHGVTARRWAP